MDKIKQRIKGRFQKKSAPQADTEENGRDYSPDSRDDTHFYRADSHFCRADSHSSRDRGHSSRADRHSSRDCRHSSRDCRHSSRDCRHSSRADRHSCREGGHSCRGDSQVKEKYQEGEKHREDVKENNKEEAKSSKEERQTRPPIPLPRPPLPPPPPLENSFYEDPNNYNNNDSINDSINAYEDVDEGNEEKQQIYDLTDSDSDSEDYNDIGNMNANNKEETEKSVEEEIKNRHVKEKNEDEKKYNREDLKENSREEMEGRKKEQTEKVGLSLTQSVSSPDLYDDLNARSEEENKHGEDVNENKKEETENSAEETKKQDVLNENEKQEIYQEPDVSVREEKKEENENKNNHENTNSNEKEEENQYYSSYVYNHKQNLTVPAGHEYRENRRFRRLPAFKNKEFRKHVPLLDLYVSYAPGTFHPKSIQQDEFILGVSENTADIPPLLPDQNRISDVLVGLPHRVLFQKRITILCRLRSSTSDPDGVRKVLHSATDLNEPTDWREAKDADCRLQNGRINLSISQFGLYAVIEEKVQATPCPKHIVVSVYVSCKLQRSIKVTIRLSSRPTDGASLPRGGTLVEQTTFSAINNRPITISIQPNHPGWISLNQVSQHILYEADILAIGPFPVSRTFHLVRRGQTLGNTLDFNICMNQPQCPKTDIQIHECLVELFPERFPVTKCMKLGLLRAAVCQQITGVPQLLLQHSPLCR